MLKSYIKKPRLISMWLQKLLDPERFPYTPVLAIEKYKIAFVPVPKAANTSIRTALMPYFDQSKLAIEGGVHQRTRPIREASQNFFPRIDESWFVFTFVRDPSARARSAWRNKLIEPKQIFKPLRVMGIQQRLNFADFLCACKEWPVWALNDHFIPQSLYLRSAMKTGGLTILRTENIAQDWKVVQAEFVKRGAPDLPDLQFLNSSRNKPAEFSVAERELLLALYEEDYRMFDYPIPQAASDLAPSP